MLVRRVKTKIDCGTHAGKKGVARHDPTFKDGGLKKFKPEQIELALSLLAQGKTYRQITTMTGISKNILMRVHSDP